MILKNVSIHSQRLTFFITLSTFIAWLWTFLSSNQGLYQKPFPSDNFNINFSKDCLLKSLQSSIINSKINKESQTLWVYVEVLNIIYKDVFYRNHFSKTIFTFIHFLYFLLTLFVAFFVFASISMHYNRVRP